MIKMNFLQNLLFRIGNTQVKLNDKDDVRQWQKTVNLYTFHSQNHCVQYIMTLWSLEYFYQMILSMKVVNEILR